MAAIWLGLAIASSSSCAEKQQHFHVQEWFNLSPKIARHIFAHDRLSRLSVGPEHLSAAMCMGNTVLQWLISYFPAFRQLKMAQANQEMDFYREQALQEMGVAVADPMQQLAGVAAAPRQAAAQPLQPVCLGMQSMNAPSSDQLSQMQQQLSTLETKLNKQDKMLQQALTALRTQHTMLRMCLPTQPTPSPPSRSNRIAALFPSKRPLPLPAPRPPKRPNPPSTSQTISDSESGYDSANSQPESA